MYPINSADNHGIKKITRDIPVVKQVTMIIVSTRTHMQLVIETPTLDEESTLKNLQVVAVTQVQLSMTRYRKH